MFKNPENKLWEVIKLNKLRDNKIPGCYLMPNDLIKLGRVRFKILEINTSAYQKLEKDVQFKKESFKVYSSVSKLKQFSEVTEIDHRKIGTL